MRYLQLLQQLVLPAELLGLKEDPRLIACITSVCCYQMVFMSGIICYSIDHRRTRTALLDEARSAWGMGDWDEIVVLRSHTAMKL